VAEPSVHETCANVHFVELADEHGLPVLLPTATVRTLLARGVEVLNLRIWLTGEGHASWLSLVDAARQHLADLYPPEDEAERKRLFNAAKAKVLRACKGGKLNCVLTDEGYRIEPKDFARWRLAQREQADKD